MAFKMKAGKEGPMMKNFPMDMKKEPMSMKKEPMMMKKDPMMMKKEPMTMKKGSAMNLNEGFDSLPSEVQSKIKGGMTMKKGPMNLINPEETKKQARKTEGSKLRQALRRTFGKNRPRKKK